MVLPTFFGSRVCFIPSSLTTCATSGPLVCVIFEAFDAKMVSLLRQITGTVATFQNGLRHSDGGGDTVFLGQPHGCSFPRIDEVSTLLVSLPGSRQIGDGRGVLFVTRHAIPEASDCQYTKEDSQHSVIFGALAIYTFYAKSQYNYER